ncbi:MAG: single-stranded DNA-binding protein [Candidatus Bathyarchaeota archaeon]|nr:MAG: single-stranded DNA-binding protein [Candidatus Bathyarchaeota archaeon]
MSEAPAELIKLDTLKSNLANLNVVVKVLSIGEPRVIFSRRDRSEHRVGEALVGDETGCVLLTLWDNQIDAMRVGDVYEIRNGYTSLFRGLLRLNMGKFGTADKVETDIEEVNTKNNLSEERHGDTSWYQASKRPYRRRRRRY